MAANSHPINVSHKYHQYYQISQLNLKAIFCLFVSAGVKTYQNKQKHTRIVNV